MKNIPYEQQLYNRFSRLVKGCGKLKNETLKLILLEVVELLIVENAGWDIERISYLQEIKNKIKDL